MSSEDVRLRVATPDSLPIYVEKGPAHHAPSNYANESFVVLVDRFIVFGTVVPFKYLSLVLLIVQNSSLVLLMRYSRMPVVDENGEPGLLYLPSTAVLMGELVKLVLCVAMILHSNNYQLAHTMNSIVNEVFVQYKGTLLLTVPSVLYSLQNNLLYLALSNLDAATFQVTYQLKTLTTALFSVVMLSKRLNAVKWISLVILMAGVSLVQLQQPAPAPVAKKVTSASNLRDREQSERALGRRGLDLEAMVLSADSVGYAPSSSSSSSPSSLSFFASSYFSLVSPLKSDESHASYSASSSSPESYGWPRESTSADQKLPPSSKKTSSKSHLKINQAAPDTHEASDTASPMTYVYFSLESDLSNSITKQAEEQMHTAHDARESDHDQIKTAASRGALRARKLAKIPSVEDDADAGFNDLEEEQEETAGADAAADERSQDSGSMAQSPMLGFICVLASCMTSGFAGVYFEKLLKGSETSLWIRNLQLGVSSIAFAVLAMITKDGEAIAKHGIFQGYNALVWSVILNQAVGGLLVALIVKYADNILKGFATSVSIVVSGLIAMVWMDFVPSIYFLVGAALVLVSVTLYGLPDDRPLWRH